jgi:hypothetical protein
MDSYGLNSHIMAVKANDNANAIVSRTRESRTSTRQCMYSVPTKTRFTSTKKKTTPMNNHDEMVLENDSLHGLEEPKDKTKTQEDTGNQGGYQGQNRKERYQAQRVLETQQPTDIDTDNDRNWKVVGRKSSTPLRKAATRGGDGGQSKTNN